MKEIWKDAFGYEGYYQVSNLGRIRTVKRFHYKAIIRKTSLDRYGYETVCLSAKNIQKNVLIHTLVAKTFILNPENKREVNHKNGVRNDNRLSNLEWVTAKENNHHSLRTGLKKCRFSAEDVKKMRDRSNKVSELSKEFNTSANYIYEIRSGRIYQFY